MFGAILFGVVGFAAFVYGKKSVQLKPIAIGIALMVYPYFISRTWLLYVIGCVLCAVLFVFRD
jgi:hypothetical protein